MTPEHSAARGRVYREHLDDLGEGHWGHAVKEAILRQRFFPTVSELRDYSENYVPPMRLPAGECGACSGVGWEIVEIDGREVARRCTCRAPRVAV